MGLSTQLRHYLITEGRDAFFITGKNRCHVYVSQHSVCWGVGGTLCSVSAMKPMCMPQVRLKRQPSLPVLLVSSLLLPRVNMYWFCDIEPCSSCTITGYSKDGTYHHIRSLFRTGKECAQFPFTVLKFHGKLPEAKKGPNVTLGKPIVI